MIVLFTDFGVAGPYVGQMKAVLYREAPLVPVVDLFHDVPMFDSQAGAYLLAAYVAEFPSGTVFVCVVDPGVGGERRAAAMEVDGCWFVGPDNGLFDIVARRAQRVRRWDITWRPERLSASFHGRDLFAPVAARLARGELPPGEERRPDFRSGAEWPDDLPRIVYIDHYGNAMTGLRAASLAPSTVIVVGSYKLPRARTFSEVGIGEPFWYENANGLAEIAVNQGDAAAVLGLRVGMELAFLYKDGN